MALTKTTPHTQGQFFLLESLVDEGQPTGDRKKKTFGSYPSSFLEALYGLLWPCTVQNILFFTPIFVIM